MSEFPAGLSRGAIENIMNFDPAVLSFSRANDVGSQWMATVSVEGRKPVDVFIDNGINEIYLQALIRLDYDEITPDERNLLIIAAMKALEPYATVGLTELAGNIWLRSAFFIDHCNMHAFTNTLKGIALAYEAYLAQLPITAEVLRG